VSITRPLRRLESVVFLSGAAALLFETVWFRQAGLAFGNSVWASSLVLAGFMGGLAIGNVAAARRGDRVPRPLRVYALAEIVIAVAGIALVWLLPAFGTALGRTLAPLLEQPWLLNPLRLLLAFVLLLIPSTAMGLTLPLLARAGTGLEPHFGRVLGRLYGWNTLGAAAGVLLGETVFISVAGVRGAAVIAAAFSAIAALGARWLDTGVPAASAHSGAAPSGGGIREAWRLLVPAALSGFCLLALEVVWFRILLLVVRGDSIAFAVMLAVVLAGISLGGLLAAARLRASPAAHRFAAMLPLLAAVASVASYAALPWSIERFASVDYPVARLHSIASLAAVLMLPVSIVSGATFTAIGAALRERLRSDAEAAGVLTVANTAGAAIGSLAAGFLLLPVLGMERSVVVLAGVYSVAGLVLPRPTRAARRLAWDVAVAAGVAVLLFPYGSMETRLLRVPFQRLIGTDPGAEIAAVREGTTETAIYVRSRLLGLPLSYRLLTNSFSMSGTAFPARRYMKLYVYWPLAVHPGVRRTLVIAYGVGNTAKALTDSPGIESIDVVDTSRDILSLSEIVHPDPAEHPLRDPRARVHVEDGRYFLQSTDRRFDLITGEPPPPGLAGVVNLYTREYFQLLHGRLAEGGIVTYWLPLSDMTDAGAKAILRAFCDVFADCSLWHGTGTNLMMAGTRDTRGGVSAEDFARQWNTPTVAAEMKTVGIERPEQLGALFIGDAGYLNALTAGVAPLVDDWPRRLDAPGSAQAREELLRGFTDVDAARERFVRSPFIERLWPERWIAPSAGSFAFQHQINAYFFDHLPWLPPAVSDVRVLEELHLLLTQSALETLVLWRLGSDADIQQLIGRLDPAQRLEPAVALQEAIGRIARRQYAAALPLFARAEQLPQVRDEALLLRLYALCMSGQTDAARQLAAERFAGSLAPAAWAWMARTFGL
jgi:predicted membrane-bound spermidine synthase